MSLDKRSIELGTEGWGVKEDNLLAFRKDRTRYVEKPFTFSRGTAATRINSSGLIETLHDEATNLLLHSNQFDTTWLDTGSEVSSGFVGYDGSSDAWKLNENTESTVHYLFQTASVTGVNTFSIYLKAGTKNKVQLYDGTNNRGAKFNLETKSVYETSGSGFIDYNIEELNDGWARYSITGATSASSFRLYLLDDSYGIAYTGDSANYIYIQDAQLETGYIATPYIETIAQAVTQPNKHETPRISYDIVDGVVSDKPHLLLEPARTNLLRYSENFKANIFETVNLNRESTSVTSPDGLTNATKIVETETTGQFRLRTNSSISTSGANTISVFAKSGERNWIVLREQSQTGAYAYFDLNNGTIGNTNLVDNATIEPYADGWYRLSITDDLTNMGIDIRIAQGDGNDNYGGVDGNGLYIYGAQLEQGSYSTSYIPTYGTTETRAAETANSCGAVQDFNDDEGVLFAEISTSWSDPITGVRALAINDGGQNNSVNIYFANNNTLRTRVYSGGALQAEIIGDYDNNRFYRVATSYKANEVKFFINGNLVGTDTSATMPVGLSKLNDFRTDALTRFEGKVKELKVFTETLNDAELRLLTKYAPKDYDAAFTADYVDNLAEFTVLRTEATDKLYYSISDGTNSVSGSATITATQVTISNIDISSLTDGTLTLSVYIEDERKQRGVTVTDTTIKDTTNTPLYSYALQQRATGATFEDLDNSESIIESLNVEV